MGNMRYISFLFLLASCTKGGYSEMKPDASLKAYLHERTIRTQYIETITDSSFSVTIPTYQDSFKFPFDLSKDFIVNLNGIDKYGRIDFDTLFVENNKYYFKRNTRYSYCYYPYGLYHSFSVYENNNWYIHSRK